MTASYVFVQSHSRRISQPDTVTFADIFACLAARSQSSQAEVHVDPALDIPVSPVAARHSLA